jgi:hypothetical protein
MKDSNDVIVQAADGFTKQLADDLDISLARMYELLGRDNPYPKAWRILRSIARHNPDGLRLIQSDFNHRCEALLQDQPATSVARINKELHDVTQSELEQKPPAERRTEILQAIAILQARLAQLELEQSQ